jgi:hypothetical protein
MLQDFKQFMLRGNVLELAVVRSSPCLTLWVIRRTFRRRRAPRPATATPAHGPRWCNRELPLEVPFFGMHYVIPVVIGGRQRQRRRSRRARIISLSGAQSLGPKTG